MTDQQDVLYSVDAHVATITLNRPDRQNTISGTMLAALSEYLLKADRDQDVRAIVITGRMTCDASGVTIFNPRYELRPLGTT